MVFQCVKYKLCLSDTHTHTHIQFPTTEISSNELRRHLSQSCSCVSLHCHILSILLSSGPLTSITLNHSLPSVFSAPPFPRLCSFHLLINSYSPVLLLFISISVSSTCFCRPFSPLYIPSSNHPPVKLKTFCVLPSLKCPRG